VLVIVTFDIPNTGQEVFLRNEDNTRESHRSILFGGEITENDYNLNGLFKFVGTDLTRAICEEKTPVAVTVSGDCGIGVDITVEATGSMTGEFFGNAACV